MATECSAGWNSVQVNTGAAKNLVAMLAIAAAATAAGILCIQFADRDLLQTALKDAWFVQGVLVTAIVALIYKLQSDIATLANLNARQRASLDAMVRKKSARLWSLFLTVALSAVLARFSSAVQVEPASTILTFLSAVMMVGSALSCIYLPFMWNELRRFLTGMVAEKESREKVEKEIKRLTEES